MKYLIGHYFSTFFTSFFSTKKNFFIFLSLLVFYSLSSLLQTFVDIGYSDEKKIVLGLMDGILAILFQVIFYNYYFSKICEHSFSFKKSLWDIPKYLFTSLILTLFLLTGAILIYFSVHLISPLLAMIICGLFIVFFLLIFIYLPMISILFDHYKEELSDTKKLLLLIKENVFFYVSLIFLVFVTTLVELSINEILSELDFSSLSKICVLFLLSLISILSTSFMIQFFQESSSPTDA